MKWVAICLAACAIIALSAPTVAQVSPFEDVPIDHWAYQAVDNLQKKKVILGYPDGKFRGRRVITRYEFAFALKRALETIGGLESAEGAPGNAGPAGPQGPAGEQGPQGPAGPPGMTPKEIDDLRRLSREFRDDLASLGVNMAAASRKLDALASDLASLHSELARMPHIHGSTWMGLRSADANGNYVDSDGRITPQLGQQFPRYAFFLGIDAPIGPAPQPKAIKPKPTPQRASELPMGKIEASGGVMGMIGACSPNVETTGTNISGTVTSETIRGLPTRANGFDPFLMPANPVQRDNPFEDVQPDRDGAVYSFLDGLQKKGVLKGYPNDNFTGGRTLTRFELAWALDRATAWVLANVTFGPNDQISSLDAHAVPDIRDVAMLQAFDRKYGPIIDQLGVDANVLKQKVGDLDARLFTTGDNPTITSGFYSGPRISTLITANNLREFHSGSFATILPLKENPASDVYLHQFVLTTPFNAIGSNGILNLGRQPIAISPLILYKPDVDTYFDIPWYDDSNYMMDGVKISSNFGSVRASGFAGQFSSVRGNKGPAWNSPIAGVDNFGMFGQPLFAAGNKPIGQNPGFLGGGTIVDQLAGINLSLPIRQMNGGFINFSALDMSGRGESGFGVPTGSGFNGLFVLGSNFNVNITPQISITGDWAKTITHTGQQTTINPHQNNAFNAGVGFSSGNLNVRAGYRYIDPLFYAPGYWGRIGNWINPTNIQGPTFRAGYDVCPNFGVTVGGDFFTGARNKAVTGGTSGGLSMDDDIHRILAGLRWDVSKNFRTTVDWEGVYWSLSGAHSGIPSLGTGTIHPTEHYITLGTGYNLTSNTTLKLNYQIGSFNGHGLGNGAGFTSSNFNTFTGQVAVKF